MGFLSVEDVLGGARDVKTVVRVSATLQPFAVAVLV